MLVFTFVLVVSALRKVLHSESLLCTVVQIGYVIYGLLQR
jgi:hypothetical protein